MRLIWVNGDYTVDGEKKMKIINKRISDLIPYDYNPRRNADAVEYVANSIKEFGFKQPIIIDRNNVIIAGHTRRLAAIKLGLQAVPCIVADDLSDEQAKALRLADNRVAERARWDEELLERELAGIFDIDMSLFDFPEDVQKEFDDIKPEEEEAEDDGGYYGDEREKTANAYNLHEYDRKKATGYFNMPILQPCNYVPQDIISFNYMLTAKDKNVGVHFYVDDYQFERIWTSPQKYIEKLKEFDCAFTPDFSLYTEMPTAMKIWNTYRSRLIGQMCQDEGLNVIPTVSWCEEKSFDYCFDGLPENSVFSISTIGVKRDDYAFGLWKAGVDEMIQRLHPSTLLIYGGKLEYDYGNIETVYFENKAFKRSED
jgi:hypothetical protein